MKEFPNYYYCQSGVIPFRVNGRGLEILLIKNREGSKWILPKGIIEPDMTAYDSAAKEAYEEAGVKGKVFKKNLGSYSINKWGNVCEVQVFALKIEKILKDYPEDFRKRKWFSLEEAIKAIKKKKVKKILSEFPSSAKDIIQN